MVKWEVLYVVYLQVHRQTSNNSSAVHYLEEFPFPLSWEKEEDQMYDG